MRIFYVLATGNPGGAELQSARLVHQMRQRGIDAQFGLYYGFGTMLGNIKGMVSEQGIPYFDLEHYPVTQKVEALRSRFVKWAPDAVIACGYPTGLHTAVAALNAGVPVRIIRLESCGHARQQFPQPEETERVGMQAATHIVGNSEAVRQSVTAYAGGDLERAHVIPNGVTIPALTTDMRHNARRHWNFRSDAALADDVIVVGLLANFRGDGLKNQMMLVRAADRVVEQYPNTLFVMAGYHSEYTDRVCEEIEGRGLQDHILMPGPIFNLDWLAGWDIAVNCSYTEGLSNAVMECMAYGLPVVLTDTDGNRDLAQHPGVRSVPVDDDAAMAEQIVRFIEDPEQRRRAGWLNRFAVRNHYSWEKVIEQWLNLMSLS